MGKIIEPRFDRVGVSRRVEEQWMRDVACPVVQADGTTEHVLTLMQIHWCQHVPALVERHGKCAPAHQCSEPCPALGLALARLEIHWFDITMLEIEEYRRLELAVSKLSPDDPLHDEHVNKANYLAAHFVSKAAIFESFYNATGGRPQDPLGHAVAQHLRRGGLPHAEIAEIIGCTVEAARQRNKTASRCSLGPICLGRMAMITCSELHRSRA